MNVITRGDMDGLICTVLLSMVEEIREIKFAHPKDAQDGMIPAASDDIVVNLPYLAGCGKWFDHHVSESGKVEGIGQFDGRFAKAPSCARVIYDYYTPSRFAHYPGIDAMMDAIDRLDSAQLTVEDVTNPEGWILLGLTLDPRTGLGPEFRKYFRWLAEYIKELPLEKVLKHPEVKKRTDRVLAEQAEFRAILKDNSHLEGNVVLTDFRGKKNLPVGNRFLVFSMYPASNVEVRLFDGFQGKVVLAAGKSIFNRTCKVSCGELLAKFGGGGHAGAGTCQLEPTHAEQAIGTIVETFKRNEPLGSQE
mgnify:CR=1 FL=1